MTDTQTCTRTEVDTDLEDLFAPETDRAEIVSYQPAAAPTGGSLLAMAQLARTSGTRDKAAMLKEAKLLGAALCDRAFYDLPFQSKGKTVHVVGPTIQLADGLIGILGDVAMQVAEWNLSDDATQYSLTARAVDLRTGVIQERPHVYALSAPPAGFQGESAARWVAMQIQAATSKAMRTTALHLIPDWLTQAAMDSARARAAALAEKDLPGARRKTAEVWAAVGITVAQLSEHVGAPQEKWTPDHMATLGGMYRAIKAGEAKLEDYFQASKPNGKPAPKADPTPSDDEAM